MIRRDFVLRMIDEFGKFMSLIVGLKNEGKNDDALKKIDDVYEGMFGLDSKVLKSESADNILNYLKNDLKFSEQYLQMISDLLFEEGLVYHESGDPLSTHNVLEKSKVMINYLIESGSTFSFDWYEKLRIVDEILG